MPGYQHVPTFSHLAEVYEGRYGRSQSLPLWLFIYPCSGRRLAVFSGVNNEQDGERVYLHQSFLHFYKNELEDRLPPGMTDVISVYSKGSKRSFGN